MGATIKASLYSLCFILLFAARAETSQVQELDYEATKIKIDSLYQKLSEISERDYISHLVSPETWTKFHEYYIEKYAKRFFVLEKMIQNRKELVGKNNEDSAEAEETLKKVELEKKYIDAVKASHDKESWYAFKKENAEVGNKLLANFIQYPGPNGRVVSVIMLLANQVTNLQDDDVDALELILKISQSKATLSADEELVNKYYLKMFYLNLNMSFLETLLSGAFILGDIALPK